MLSIALGYHAPTPTERGLGRTRAPRPATCQGVKSGRHGKERLATGRGKRAVGAAATQQQQPQAQQGAQQQQQQGLEWLLGVFPAQQASSATGHTGTVAAEKLDQAKRNHAMQAATPGQQHTMPQGPELQAQRTHPATYQRPQLQPMQPLRPGATSSSMVDPTAQMQQRGAKSAAAASPSLGPRRANASDLLAGVPLEQMLQRKEAQQQLDRQLNGGSGIAGGGWPPSAAEPASSGSVGGARPWPSTPSTADPSYASSSSSLNTTFSPPGVGRSWIGNNGSSKLGSSFKTEHDGLQQQAGLSAVTSPEAAMALAAYDSAVAHRRMVPVTFRLQHEVEPGQRLRLVGGHKSLGNWALHAAPELKPSSGDVWQAVVKLPAGSVTSYKYALLDSSGNLLALQQGNSGVLAVRFEDARLEVQDAWGGDSAGGGVLGEGETGLSWRGSRESRLTAWAADMFRQVAAMRQDLRASRMELMGAREEAREARAEALRLQSQLLDRQVRLAEAETEAALGRARLKQSETVNGMLRQQLAETQASLNQAVELLTAQEEEDDEDCDEDGEEEWGMEEEGRTEQDSA